MLLSRLRPSIPGMCPLADLRRGLCVLAGCVLERTSWGDRPGQPPGPGPASVSSAPDGPHRSSLLPPGLCPPPMNKDWTPCFVHGGMECVQLGSQASKPALIFVWGGGAQRPCAFHLVTHTHTPCSDPPQSHFGGLCSSFVSLMWFNCGAHELCLKSPSVAHSA